MNQVILAGGFEGGDEQFALSFSPGEYCGFSSCRSGLPSIVPENTKIRTVVGLETKTK